MREELVKIIEKYYNSELEKYKEDSDESDEECKWSVSEFVVGEIDEIMNEIVEK
jgi:septum formation topological specificity factor MinE